MELSEDQIIEKYAEQGMANLRKNILPHEYEVTCFS